MVSLYHQYAGVTSRRHRRRNNGFHIISLTWSFAHALACIDAISSEQFSAFAHWLLLRRLFHYFIVITWPLPRRWLLIDPSSLWEGSILCSGPTVGMRPRRGEVGGHPRNQIRSPVNREWTNEWMSQPSTPTDPGTMWMVSQSSCTGLSGEVLCIKQGSGHLGHWLSMELNIDGIYRRSEGSAWFSLWIVITPESVMMSPEGSSLVNNTDCHLNAWRSSRRQPPSFAVGFIVTGLSASSSSLGSILGRSISRLLVIITDAWILFTHRSMPSPIDFCQPPRLGHRHRVNIYVTPLAWIFWLIPWRHCRHWCHHYWSFSSQHLACFDDATAAIGLVIYLTASPTDHADWFNTPSRLSFNTIDAVITDSRPGMVNQSLVTPGRAVGLNNTIAIIGLRQSLVWSSLPPPPGLRHLRHHHWCFVINIYAYCSYALNIAAWLVIIISSSHYFHHEP